jgi:formylglycine-generating enzyme required for sulfatase activity
MDLDIPQWAIVDFMARVCEEDGDPYGAAERLVAYGDREQVLDGAQRFVALGDLYAAGDAYLRAEEPRQALACYQQVGDQEGLLRCWQALGDDAAIGATLLELGRAAEARPNLETALAQADEDAAAQARIGLHLARALHLDGESEIGYTHYLAAHAHLLKLPATAASTEAWVALGQWGAAVGRDDRMQEGYAAALELLDQHGPRARWRAVAEQYRQAAAAIGNRRLAAKLAAQIADAPEEEPAPPPDPARLLLDQGDWQAALDALRPRVAQGEDAALLLLAELPETPAVPLEMRLEAAGLLGTHDPRLLDPTTGENRLGTYWCQLEAGPFWYGPYNAPAGEQPPELRQETLPYRYQVARYPVTNAEYARFIAAGGYEQPDWWTPNGWAYQQEQNWTQPRFWDRDDRNAPTQPVVGVSWFEAMAYCRWLTAQGHTQGWLPRAAEIRLPTSLEWERAARHTDERAYPWGTEEPTPEHANYAEADIGHPSAVGCFPAGAAMCGARDLSGNVWEWTTTPYQQPWQGEPEQDFTPNARVVLRGGAWYSDKSAQMCGARVGNYANLRNIDRGFRIIRSLRSSE